MKKAVFSFFAFVTITIGGVYFYFFKYDVIIEKKTSETYLSHLAKGEYQAAFDNVSYFDWASDVPPKTPEAAAKQIWVGRVNELHSKGIFLKSFENLRIYTDDGAVMGDVTLTLVENGKEVKTKAQLYFNGTKIQRSRLETPSARDNKGMHPFELATFGDIDI